MGQAVNTNEMSVLCHLLYEIFISVDAFAHEEKGHADSAFPEAV